MGSAAEKPVVGAYSTVEPSTGCATKVKFTTSRSPKDRTSGVCHCGGWPTNGRTVQEKLRCVMLVGSMVSSASRWRNCFVTRPSRTGTSVSTPVVASKVPPVGRSRRRRRTTGAPSGSEATKVAVKVALSKTSPISAGVCQMGG